jgi:integrase
MTTGVRAGEVSALQVRDIRKDRLLVRPAWSEDDKLKGTKSNTERTVPPIPVARSELPELNDANPFGDDADTFVFYSPDVARPMRVEVLLDLRRRCSACP